MSPPRKNNTCHLSLRSTSIFSPHCESIYITQMVDSPETPTRIVFSKHSFCFPVVWLWLVFLPFLVFSSTYFISFFFYLSTHQLQELSSSPERKECIIKQETVRKAVTPLWHLVLIAPFTISLKLIRDRRPGGMRGREPELQTVWIVRTVGVHVSLQRLSMMHVPVYCLLFWVTFLSERVWYHLSLILQQLQHACECTNAKQRFILGQTPARGARASWVHHCRTHGSGARLCSEALCCLAYFSTISNGPVPKRSSSCELMVDRGAERVERISQRENSHPCQGRGPPRPEWHTLNRWQGPECWPTGIRQRDGWSHTGREYRTVLPCSHSSVNLEQT